MLAAKNLKRPFFQEGDQETDSELSAAEIDEIGIILNCGERESETEEEREEEAGEEDENEEKQQQ